MSPAATPTLSSPSSALSNNDTLAYIKSSWPWKSGTSPYLTFAQNPFGGEDFVLAIEYPKGSYTGGTGGIGGMHLEVFGSEVPQRAMVSYEVAFSEWFDFVKGGKLPGLFGGESTAGCSGGTHSDQCFSLRLMWRTDGAGEVYAYVPNFSTFCDSTIICDTTYGFSVNRGSWTFAAGSWDTVTEVAILNSDPGPTCVANGILEMYAGSSLAFTKSNMIFRTTEIGLSTFYISSFFGGSSASFASKGGFTYYRNFQFFAGTTVSEGSGETVNAAVPS